MTASTLEWKSSCALVSHNQKACLCVCLCVCCVLIDLYHRSVLALKRRFNEVCCSCMCACVSMCILNYHYKYYFTEHTHTYTHTRKHTHIPESKFLRVYVRLYAHPETIRPLYSREGHQASINKLYPEPISLLMERKSMGPVSLGYYVCTVRGMHLDYNPLASLMHSTTITKATEFCNISKS